MTKTPNKAIWGRSLKTWVSLRTWFRYLEPGDKLRNRFCTEMEPELTWTEPWNSAIGYSRTFVLKPFPMSPFYSPRNVHGQSHLYVLEKDSCFFLLSWAVNVPSNLTSHLYNSIIIPVCQFQQWRKQDGNNPKWKKEGKQKKKNQEMSIFESSPVTLPT